MNGQKIGEPIDLYDPLPEGAIAHAAQFGETELEVVEILDGVNELTVEVIGRNRASAGYHFGIDFIDLWPEGFDPSQ